MTFPEKLKKPETLNPCHLNTVWDILLKLGVGKFLYEGNISTKFQQN